MRLNDAQIQLLERLVALPLVTPDDFTGRWTVSYRQISQICCCSTSTVEHWFSEGAARRSPAASYQKLLALTCPCEALIADFLLTHGESLHFWGQFWQ